MSAQGIKTFCLAVSATVLAGSVTFAQDPKLGKLKMSVSPKQAYTFVDGKAIDPAIGSSSSMSAPTMCLWPTTGTSLSSKTSRSIRTRRCLWT